MTAIFRHKQKPPGPIPSPQDALESFISRRFTKHTGEQTLSLQLCLVRSTPLVQNGILWNSLEWGERMASSQSAGEILTIREVAALLRVVEKTVYTMAQKSEIPGFKVRGQWRFKRNDIDAWIDSQKSMAAQDRIQRPDSNHTR